MALPVSAAICGPGSDPAADRTPATSVDTGVLRQPPRTCHLVRAQPDPIRGTTSPAGHSRAGSGMRVGHRRSQAHERATVFRRAVTGLSAVVSARSPRPCPGPATGRPRRCPGVRGCWRSCGRCPVEQCPPRTGGRCMSAATGSGRLTGVRWWGAATAARPAGAARQAAGGAARAHRSWPAAPGPGPPRRSARRAGGR
jgi:hypothetical protein